MKAFLLPAWLATVSMLTLGWSPDAAASSTWRGADAWGSYRPDGTVYYGGHGVSSVLWSASSRRYEITLSAGYYSVDDVTVVSLASTCPAGATARQSSVGGKLLVFVVDTAGESIQCLFTFASWLSENSPGPAPLDNALAYAAPAAIGTVQRLGTEGTGSWGIDAVAWNASLERYEVDVTGYYMSIYDIAAATLTGDAGNCPAGAEIRHSSVSGKLLFYVVAANGSRIQCAFRFVAWPANVASLLADGFEGNAQQAARSIGAYAYINRYNLEEVRHAHRVESVLWNSTLQRFELTLQGIHYSIGDRAFVTARGDAGGCPAGTVTRIGSVSGLLLVYFIAPDGERIQCSFSVAAQLD